MNIIKALKTLKFFKK